MRYRTEKDPGIEAGFTLIEVMISLVIMLMVVTVAFAGFRIGLNAWERGGKAIDRLDRRSDVERLIRRQLAVAYPKEVSVDKKTFVLFQGTSRNMEFVADYSLSDGPGDFRKVDYVVQGGSILYGEKEMVGTVSPFVEEVTGTVIGAFGNVTFEYLGADGKGKAVWLNEWPLADAALPSAVRVRIDGDSIVVPLVNR